MSADGALATTIWWGVLRPEDGIPLALLRTREDAERWRESYAPAGVVRQVRFALVLLPLE